MRSLHVEMTVIGAKRYIIRHHLGSGTYGDVYEAMDQVTHKLVAVKKLKSEELTPEDVVVVAENVTTLSEIQILGKLDHPNIIKLLNVYEHDNQHHLVFELMDTDLYALIRDPSIPLTFPDIKAYMQMFLQGLAYLHHKSILHRDLKTNNLLIGRDGQLKLADFGMSCYSKNGVVFSAPEVFVTMFRAPELLRRRATNYGPEVEMWAAGCIFGELIIRRTFFRDIDRAKQLREIYKRFLVPIKTQSQSICKELEYPPMEYRPIEYLRRTIPDASEDCLDLLQQMFVYKPNDRITAQQALEHKYFKTSPLPTPTHLLPRRSSTQVASTRVSVGLPLRAQKRRASSLFPEGIPKRARTKCLVQAKASPLFPEGVPKRARTKLRRLENL